MDTAVYKPLSHDFFLSRYPHTWPLRIYVRNDDGGESKGYREFTGPGDHYVGEYSYPLFYRDLATELDALRALIFDGFRVYAHLTDDQKRRTSADNVSDTLDALVRAQKPAR